MGSPTPQQFCLRWNNHPSALLSVFEQLLQTEVFTDVTIAIDGVFLKAHKLVLSACSPYFQMIFASHTSKHPIIILKDVHFLDMRALLDFMYRGEVSVDQERLPQFLRLAETLRIRGLAEVGDCTQQTGEGAPKNLEQHRSSVELDRQKGSAEPYTPSYSPFHPYQLSSPYPPETPQSPNDLLKRPGSPYSSYSSRRKRGRPPKLGSGIDYLTDPLEMLDVKVDSMASCSSYTPRHSSTPLTPQSTEGQDDENSRDYSRNRAASEEIVVKKEWTPPIEHQPGSSKEDSASTNHSGESNGDEGCSGPHVNRVWIPSQLIQRRIQSAVVPGTTVEPSVQPPIVPLPVKAEPSDWMDEPDHTRPSVELQASQLRARLPSDITITPVDNSHMAHPSRTVPYDQYIPPAGTSPRRRPILQKESPSLSSTEEFVRRIINNVRKELAMSGAGEIERRGYSKGNRWNI